MPHEIATVPAHSDRANCFASVVNGPTRPDKKNRAGHLSCPRGLMIWLCGCDYAFNARRRAYSKGPTPVTSNSKEAGSGIAVLEPPTGPDELLL